MGILDEMELFDRELVDRYVKRLKAMLGKYSKDYHALNGKCPGSTDKVTFCYLQRTTFYCPICTTFNNCTDGWTCPCCDKGAIQAGRHAMDRIKEWEDVRKTKEI